MLMFRECMQGHGRMIAMIWKHLTCTAANKRSGQFRVGLLNPVLQMRFDWTEFVHDRHHKDISSYQHAYHNIQDSGEIRSARTFNCQGGLLNADLYMSGWLPGPLLRAMPRPFRQLNSRVSI
jgi:hypothetical protein